jgi:hypothetical protein
MDTIAVPPHLMRCWRLLTIWQRRLLIVVAALVGTAWIGIGSIGLLVLLGSPLGCPPTTGCRERKATDCSSWNTFMEPTSDRSCDGNR